MTRRQALGFLLSLGIAESSLLRGIELPKKRMRVVIAGGGTGGIIAYAMLKAYAPSLEVTLITPNRVHLYQPGACYVAAGEMLPNEMIKEIWQFVDDKEWIKEKIIHFQPERNLLITDAKKVIPYDYLILALGIEPDFDAIEGMDTSLLGHNGITSIYNNDTLTGSIAGALQTKKWIETICKEAKQKRTDILFAKAHGHVKCGGAILSTLYLLADTLRGNGPLCKEHLASNTQITYAHPGKRLFGLSEYNAPLVARSKSYGNIKHRYLHTLIGIDSEKKKAIFEYKLTVKSTYDPDFEEWSYKILKKRIVLKYDFLHVSPPMLPPACLRESTLAKRSGMQKGFVEVDRETLQHKRFGNVFAVGDCAGIPLGKTAISAKYQAKTATENILALLTDAPMQHYDGYSGCPIKLSYKDVLFAEFDYEGAVSRIIKSPCIPKHSLWEYDRYRLPQLYWEWLHGEKV